MQTCVKITLTVFYKAMHQHFKHFAFSLKGRIRMRSYWKCVCLKRTEVNRVPSVLCQQVGVDHMFFTHHISKCSGPPHPILFDQSLTLLTWQPKSKQKQGDISLAGVIKLIGGISSPQRVSITQGKFFFSCLVC